MFSATLHSPEVKRLAAAICQDPLLVDLKGKDAVPECVDHVLLRLDPAADATWLQSTPKVGLGRACARACTRARGACAVHAAASCASLVSCTQPLHAPQTHRHTDTLAPNTHTCTHTHTHTHTQTYTDNVHTHDACGPNVRTPECMSQAVKVLKQRLLKRIVDTHSMDQCLIFCRWAWCVLAGVHVHVHVRGCWPFQAFVILDMRSPVHAS
jgi:hypothetical protein